MPTSAELEAARKRRAKVTIRLTEEERQRLYDLQRQLNACTLREAVLQALEVAAAQGYTAVQTDEKSLDDAADADGR